MNYEFPILICYLITISTVFSACPINRRASNWSHKVHKNALTNFKFQINWYPGRGCAQLAPSPLQHPSAKLLTWRPGAN